jgi:glucan phosphoethanolaminetransferase (alkaline phosphatase superfamily)
MVRYLGLFTIIPATILLAISFFVLVVLNKLTSKELKRFAIFIVILLWFSSVLLVSLGMYIVTTGKHPMFQMHKEMMKDMMMHKGAMMMRQQDKNAGGKMMMPANPAQ